MFDILSVESCCSDNESNPNVDDNILNQFNTVLPLESGLNIAQMSTQESMIEHKRKISQPNLIFKTQSPMIIIVLQIRRAATSQKGTTTEHITGGGAAISRQSKKCCQKHGGFSCQ